MTGSLQEIAERIHRNPLGRLMFAQRELFHSNLLAWFADTMPRRASRVFGALGIETGRGDPTAQRELERLDLVIDWPEGARLIVENKTFKVPDPAQLRDYSAKPAAQGDRVRRILLAPAEPAFELPDGWGFLGYRALAGLIREAIGPGRGYEAQTMLRWADLADDLSDLIATVEIHDPCEAVWIDYSMTTGPGLTPQLLAALRNARASRVAARLDRAIDGAAVYSDMSNGKPVLGFRLPGLTIDGQRITGEWQLSGNDFCRMATVEDAGHPLFGTGDEPKLRRIDWAGDHPDLFAMPPGLAPLADPTKYWHYQPRTILQKVPAPAMTITELLHAHTHVVGALEAYRAGD